MTPGRTAKVSQAVTPSDVAGATAAVRQLTQEMREEREATAEVWRGIAATLRMLTAMREGNWPPKDEEEDR